MELAGYPTVDITAIFTSDEAKGGNQHKESLAEV